MHSRRKSHEARVAGVYCQPPAGAPGLPNRLRSAQSELSEPSLYPNFGLRESPSKLRETSETESLCCPGPAQELVWRQRQQHQRRKWRYAIVARPAIGRPLLRCCACRGWRRQQRAVGSGWQLLETREQLCACHQLCAWQAAEWLSQCRMCLQCDDSAEETIHAIGEKLSTGAQPGTVPQK